MTEIQRGAPAGAPAAVTLRSFAPDAERLRELFRLALPITVVQVGLMSMGAVDTAMVGRVSAVDIAAVATGNLYFFGVAVFGMGLLFSLDPVISQAVGANDREGIARGMQRGFVLAAGLTVLASLLLLPAGAFLTAARQPAEVIPVAAAYTRGLIPGMFGFYGFIVLRQSLQAMSRVRAIVITTIGANVLNVGLNWILIFGNLGSPRLGAVGSAYGTSIARWTMMLGVLTVGWPVFRDALRPLRREALNPAPLIRIIKVGAPIGMQQFLEFGVFGAAGLLMGLIGTVALASHQVALQLAALTFMLAVGVAAATSVIVGQAVGRGEPATARRAAGAGLVVGVGFMVLTAIMFLTIPGPLARLFATDQEVLALAVLLLPIAGAFQVADGVQVVAAGALRGVGDTRVPMLLNLVGFWFVGLPLCWLLAFTFDLGPEGVWWGLATGLGVVAVLLTLRIRSRFGRDLRRIVIDHDTDEGGVS